MKVYDSQLYADRTRVIHVRDIGAEQNIKRVHRPTKWGNPHPIANGVSRESAIARFFSGFVKRTHLHADLDTLRSGESAPVLACYCNPKPCHADVIAAFLDVQQVRPDLGFDIIPNPHLSFTKGVWVASAGELDVFTIVEDEDVYSSVRMLLELSLDKWSALK